MSIEKDVTNDLKVIKTDVSNFVETAISDVKTVFNDLGIEIPIAEKVIENVLTNDIPIAESVAQIVYPPADKFLEILSFIGGNLIAIAKASNDTTQVINGMLTNKTKNLSLQEADTLAKSAKTTYEATKASVDKIGEILHNGISYVPKSEA
jgi:hypothetical protein